MDQSDLKTLSSSILTAQLQSLKVLEEIYNNQQKPLQDTQEIKQMLTDLEQNLGSDEDIVNEINTKLEETIKTQLSNQELLAGLTMLVEAIGVLSDSLDKGLEKVHDSLTTTNSRLDSLELRFGTMSQHVLGGGTADALAATIKELEGRL